MSYANQSKGSECTLESHPGFITYSLVQRTLAGFTVKSLRASPRNSSSIIRDFLSCSASAGHIQHFFVLTQVALWVPHPLGLGNAPRLFWSLF